MDFFIAIILIVVSFPIYKIIFKFVYRDSDDFQESVKHSFTPDIISLFKGRFWKDQVGEAKLGVFIFGCIMVVILEFFIVKAVISLLM